MEATQGEKIYWGSHIKKRPSPSCRKDTTVGPGGSLSHFTHRQRKRDEAVCLVQDTPSNEIVHLMLKVSFLLDSFSQISIEVSPSYF